MPDGLAEELGISPRRLAVLRRKYRMEHGDEAEEKLRRFLTGLVQWKRRQDEVRLLGRRSGYVETRFAAIQVRGTQNEEEPEAIPAELQEEYADAAGILFGVLKHEEKARREAASRAQRMRQAELDLRKAGKPHEHYVRTIETALEAMRRDAST